MKKYLFLLIGVIFLATSCKDDTQNDDTPGPVTDSLIFHNSSGPFEVIVAEENPCFHHYGAPQMFITGGGNATVIGEFSVKNTFCFYMQGDTIRVVGDWFGFLTADDGDEVHTQVLDPLNDWYTIDSISYMEYSVIGGTGRFENATGDLLMYGTFGFTSPTTGVWELEGGGTITY